MHLTVHDRGDTIHIRSAVDARRGGPGTIGFHDEDEARRFLRRHFRDGHELGRLREALGAEVYGLTRLDDDEVIAAAALRLASGAWRAASTSAQAPAAARVVARAAPPPGNAYMRGTGGRAAPARGPAPPAPRSTAPRPAGNPAAAPAAEWPELADQPAQAATLEQAARSGTPFCEICARRAQAEAEAAP